MAGLREAGSVVLTLSLPESAFKDASGHDVWRDTFLIDRPMRTLACPFGDWRAVNIIQLKQT
jgi:hypothetical protein